MKTLMSNIYLNCDATKSEGNPRGTAEDWKRGNINSTCNYGRKCVCVSENRCEKNACEKRKEIK